MKKEFIIHPFLFTIYPVLFLFSRNIDKIPVVHFSIVVVIMVLSTFLLWVLLSSILKNMKKAGLLVSLFVVWICFYGPFFDMILGFSIGKFLVARHRYILPIWSIIFAFSAVFIIIRRSYFSNLTKILNFVSVSLIVFCLVDIGRSGTETKIMSAPQEKESNEYVKKIDREDSEKTIGVPDIYYIILDMYASQSTLKDFYNFDNREFYEYLNKKDFYIAQRSRCNYPNTALSLAASLNMKYINDQAIIAEGKMDNLKIYNSLILNSELMKFLKSKGFKCITVGFYNKYADLNFVYEHYKEFSKYIFIKYLLLMTPLRFAVDTLGFGYDKQAYRRGILFHFEQLIRIGDIKGPKFIFAHIYSPHPPFVFGPDGEKVGFIKSLRIGPRQMYINQVIFINKKVKELINVILSKSESPPIIILQADHGLNFNAPSSYLLNEQYLRHRMSIFNAFYLPGNGKDFLYDSISPVNSFRVILNHYFNTDYELLKDENWVVGYQQPHEFINVTDKF